MLPKKSRLIFAFIITSILFLIMVAVFMWNIAYSMRDQTMVNYKFIQKDLLQKSSYISKSIAAFYKLRDFDFSGSVEENLKSIRNISKSIAGYYEIASNINEDLLRRLPMDDPLMLHVRLQEIIPKLQSVKEYNDSIFQSVSTIDSNLQLRDLIRKGKRAVSESIEILEEYEDLHPQLQSYFFSILKTNNLRTIERLNVLFFILTLLISLIGILSFLYILEKSKLQKALLISHQLLETKVQERTRELRNSNEQLADEIQEREHLEFELRLKSDALDNSLNGFDIIEESGKFVYVNKAYVEMWGYENKDEIVGTAPASHCQDPNIPAEIIAELKKKGKCVKEFIARRKDGSVFDVLMYARLAHDETGREIYPSASIDVTERSQALTALQESEERFRALFEQAGGYCMILDPDTPDGIPIIVDANEAACRVHGYTSEEFIGRPVADIDDEQGKRLVKKHTAEIMTGEPFYIENMHIRKDGTRFPVAVNAKRIDMSDGRSLILTTEYDITERKIIEKALQEKTDFLDKVIDSAALSTWISDDKGTAIRANPACLDFYGAVEDQFIGKYNLFKDNMLKRSGVIPDVKGVFESGEPLSIVMEYTFGDVDHIKAEKPTHKTLNSIFTPIHDNSGRVSNVIVQTIDLTDIRKLENELIQAQKMESIVNLAGGIAHEFNNMLAIIIGNNELLMDELPEKSLARESSEEIRIAGLRAKDVVKQLLTFSRQDDAVQKVVDFRSVVKESMKLIRSSTPANISIEQKIADDVFQVVGNDTQINQLLINVCNNAIDALPDKNGVVSVTVMNKTVDTHYAAKHRNLKPGYYVELEIADNGSGIDRDTLDRIFEPYFTTKEIGKGTGIGLAVVHGIVERHNGVIIADSQINEGTTITVLLPAHDGGTENGVGGGSLSLPTGNERILYVDDEPAIATMGKRLLESLGYTTQSATDPTEALEMVRENPNGIDLLITDMAMPNMTGDELAIEALKRRSDLPIIICTGYSSKISENRAAEIGVSSLIMKPLNKEDLAVMVRKVLDSKNS